MAALHVTNGDIVVDLLRRAGLAERALAWADVLHEGPVPGGLDEAELRRVRAELIAGADGVDAAAVRRRFEERDRALAANRAGEYQLWFEADLYDQLQIAQVLAALAGLGVDPGRVTLVCIGEYPGIAHFGGLGQLEPGQLPGLLGAATRLTAEALDLGVAAWAALRADHPGGLAEIVASRSPELRFLGEAYDRLCREYPSTRDGLSLTERRILAAVAAEEAPAGAAAPAAAVFARLGEREPRPFLADLFFLRIVARLAAARVPLLAADPPAAPVTDPAGAALADPGAPGADPGGPLAGVRLRLTAAGRRVLGGQADHLALSGIDRWIGGVHLQGRDARWRFDEGTESIA